MELNLDSLRVSISSIAKCDFSGKSHSNITMEDSAKVALFASDTVRPPESAPRYVLRPSGTEVFSR
jgi:hypothetical protein